MSTKIEWAQNADGSQGETWNPIRARNLLTGQTGTFCTKVSSGCANCYAETHNRRMLPHGSAGLKYSVQNEKNVENFIDAKMLTAPLRKKKPTTWFVCSMTDLFHHLHDFRMIAGLFGIMALARQHTFIVLTKRPERAREFFRWLAGNPLLTGDPRAEPATYTTLECGPALASIKCAASLTDDFLVNFVARFDGPRADDGYPAWPLPNVILGTSIEDQETADRRRPHLMACPAACRMLSIEPLLGPVDLHFPAVLRRTKPVGFDEMNPKRQEEVILQAARAEYIARDGVEDWVIVGFESGAGARPGDIAWLRSVRDQCAEVAIPCFVKQLGAVPMDAGSFKWMHHTIGERILYSEGGSGKPAATVWDNGTWHTWDRAGAGGENSREPSIEAAKAQALAAVLRAGQFPLNLKSRKGGDPSEWPIDLRVREMPDLGGDR